MIWLKKISRVFHVSKCRGKSLKTFYAEICLLSVFFSQVILIGNCHSFKRRYWWGLCYFRKKRCYIELATFLQPCYILPISQEPPFKSPSFYNTNHWLLTKIVTCYRFYVNVWDFLPMVQNIFHVNPLKFYCKIYM